MDEAISKKKRFWELDFIRGICVILMVIDHVLFVAMYAMPQIGVMLGTDKWNGIGEWLNDNYWYGNFRLCIRFPVLFLFFLICGISCTLTKSNAKRGVLCLAVACAVTTVTVLIDKVMNIGISIYFGVLHMLGIAMLLYALFDFLGGLPAKKIKDERGKHIAAEVGKYLAPTIGAILFIVYFACFYGGIEGDVFNSNVVIKDESLSVFASFFVNIFPNSNSGIASIGGADYWPLLPWAAVVLIGGFIGRLVYNDDRIKYFAAPIDGKWNKPICFVGRHALIVYVCHQVAAVALLFVVTLFMLI